MATTQAGAAEYGRLATSPKASRVAPLPAGISTPASHQST